MHAPYSPSAPPPSHTQSPYPPRSLVRDGQTSPHRPRLVVSRSTCLHSPPPHANVWRGAGFGPICRGTQIEPATSMYETCNGTVPECAPLSAPEYQHKNGLASCALDLPLQLPGTSDCQLQQSPWLAADSGPEHVDNRSRQVLIAPALRQLEDHVPCPLSLCDCQCPRRCMHRERESE
jgi:hypothetical protein